jgi:hypothetical protein
LLRFAGRNRRNLPNTPPPPHRHNGERRPSVTRSAYAATRSAPTRNLSPVCGMAPIAAYHCTSRPGLEGPRSHRVFDAHQPFLDFRQLVAVRNLEDQRLADPQRFAVQPCRPADPDRSQSRSRLQSRRAFAASGSAAAPLARSSGRSSRRSRRPCLVGPSSASAAPTLRRTRRIRGEGAGVSRDTLARAGRLSACRASCRSWNGSRTTSATGCVRTCWRD